MLHPGALIRRLRARAVKVYYCTMVTFVVLSTRDYVTYPDRQIYLPPSELRADLKPVVGARDTLLLRFVNCELSDDPRPALSFHTSLCHCYALHSNVISQA